MVKEKGLIMERKRFIRRKIISKPIKNPTNPVKVTFLCEYGAISSPRTVLAFQGFLKEKGLDRHVVAESGGTIYLQQKGGAVNGQDFVVVMGKDLYSKFATPGAEKIVLEKMTGKVADQIFEGLLTKIKKKFELE